MFNIKALLGPGDYTSETDQLLMDHYHRVPLSASQREEKEKYDRIFEGRDCEQP